MPIDVRMPDGTLVKNVPDNITQADLLARYNAFSAQPATSIAPEIQVKPQAPQVGPEGAPIPPILQTQTQVSEDRPLAGSARKGIVNLQQTGENLRLANLMELQDAYKQQYGQGYENAPPEKIVDLQKLEDDINTSKRVSTSYDLKRQTLSKQYGITPLSQKLDEVQSTPEYQNASGIQKFQSIGETLLKNPGDIPSYIGNIGLESLPNSMAMMASAVVARYMTGSPSSAAVAGGTTSSFTEFGNQYVSNREQGKSHQDAMAEASVKSGIIGYFDAVSFGSAGKALEEIIKEFSKGAIKSTAKEVGKETVKQAAYGAAGEAVGSVATGQPIDPRAVVEEALGEIAGAPMEAVTTYRSNKAIADQNVRPTPPPVSERVEPEVTPIRPATTEPATVETSAPTKVDTSHDTQAMLDELSGKDVEYVPEEEIKPIGPPRLTEEEKAQLAPLDKLNAKDRKIHNMPTPELQAMADQGMIQWSDEFIDSLNKPKQEVIQTTPMGNNTEYHVLQNDQGHVANLYDKDAGQYVPGSLRIFPTETFGEQTETAAKNFVQEEQDKAAQYEPSIKEEPTGIISEEERQFTPVGGRLINKKDADKLARESAIALEQNLKNQEIQRDKQIRREIREDRFPAAETPSLASALKALGGINQSNKLDMLGDTGKLFNYESAFSKDGEDLLTYIEKGDLDQYLPHQIRLSNTPEGEAFDPRPGYEYISKVIESKQKAYDYEYELAKIDHENQIKEKYLAKQYMEPNEEARVARIEDLNLGPMYEKIKAKPGANVGRIAKMLGPQLYGSMENISEVSVKEMVQNSFDAIKTMIEKGVMDKGNISINMNVSDRSITIKDNGSGMSPDVLQNTFFTIAGTNKETEFGSGGFGIAKMLFLFGNQNVEVTTMRDGQISHFVASGEQLKASLDDPSQAPDINTYAADQYNKTELREDFPQGHGTIVTVVVPETFTNPSTGKTEDIPFVADKFEFPVLRYSPLFSNIEMRFNEENLMLGSSFPKEDYTTFVNADFDWGTARIYVSTSERDRWGKNLHVLSNGLWQFSEELTKKPGDKYADNIPYRFYVDIVSRAKPDEQGYPFTFNRQSLTKEATADLDLIKNYLWLNYTKKDISSTSTSFGNVHYLSKKNGKINVSAKEDLNPEVNVQEISDGIQEGSNVKVIDGKLIVNGKEIPALNLQDLKNATIDLDELKIPQDNVKSNDIMVHDNLGVEIEGNFRPITELAKEKFGERFDQFMYEIGDVFKTLRDRVVYLNIKGELPNYDDVGYKDLANHAIGISFDKEYRGVSIKLPFNGMFINPALPEFTDPEGAGFGLFGTMIHELAHYQVRDHEEKFPAEMQRLSIVLKKDKEFDLNGLEQELVKSVIKNKDILDYLNDLGVNYESEAIGQRFKDSEYERATRRTSQNISESGRARQPGREVSSNIKSRDQIARQMQQYQSVPSANQTTQRRVAGQPPPRNFRGQEVLPQWHGPEESKIDDWIYNLQNKQIDTKRVQEAIGDIEENWNVYEKEQLYHGRTASGIRNFLLKELLPVIKEIERLKISPEDIRTYLHNRHAEERNIRMNEKNPDIYDPKTGRTTPNPLKDKASGIHTNDARAYLAGLDPARKQILEQIATKFDEMVKGTQDVLIASGAETKETIDKWNKIYKHYVPLFRVEDDMARPSGLSGVGQGFGSRGDFSKRAMGSEKDVQDILSNIIAQRERALIRAEKIRVGRALYGMAIQNPNPDFWLPINPDAIRNKKQAIAELRRMGIPDAEDVVNNLMAEPKERYLKKINAAEGAVEPDENFDFDSGLPVNESKEVVASKINVMARYKDFVFPVRINGKDRYIFFNKNDPRSLRMVQSLKNLDVENLGLALSIAGKFTRWFKNVNTQYNPVFGLVNFVRDFSGALLNLTSTEIKGEQAKVIAGAYKAMGGILNVHRAERKGKPLPTGPWAKLYQEARAEGFQTGYRDSLIRNQEEMQIIEHTLEQFKDSNTKKAFYSVIGGLTDFNDMMENAIRLSAYKVALDKGLSKQKAAIIAKNLTVNFDKKGAKTAQVNALYAFFNASIQGTERIYQTIKGPKGKMIIGGGILAGMVQAVMLAAAGYDDDDPPEFVREKNFIIPLIDGTYLTVPYPLGYNVLPNAGRIVMDFMLHGGRDPGKHSVSLLASTLNSFNPLGNTSLSFQTLAPTIADPLVALGENKDAFGRPISRKDRATAPTPGYTRSRETASKISQGLAYFLNLASNGSKYQKGYISPTADELDFIAGQVGGGLYREVTKAGKAISAIVTGEEIPTYQRPVVGRFAGKTGSQASVSQSFYDNVTRMTDHENEIKGRMKNREDVEGYLTDHPEARLWKRANSVENKINELNKRKRLFAERGFPKERIQAVDAQKTMLMQRFNTQVKNLRPD